MRISTKGRHAVMAMVDLARNGQGKPVSLAEIAARQDISLSYMEQLIARLKSRGLVKSLRGPGGGYMLATQGDRITVSDVVNAVDDPAPRQTIDDLDAANGRQLTDMLWQAMHDEISQYLESVTLADVSKNNFVLTPPSAKETEADEREREAVLNEGNRDRAA